jgi:hypothetical protein
MTVEGTGDDTRLAGDLTQAQTAETAFLEKFECGGDDRSAGGFFALLP